MDNSEKQWGGGGGSGGLRMGVGGRDRQTEALKYGNELTEILTSWCRCWNIAVEVAVKRLREQTVGVSYLPITQRLQPPACAETEFASSFDVTPRRRGKG